MKGSNVSSGVSGVGLVGTVSQMVSAYGTLPPTLSYSLSYDMMGQVNTQTLPSSTTITNAYTAGFLASEGFSATPEVSALIYNPAGTLRQITYSNTMKQLADYDALSRPKGYRFERNGTAIWTNGSYASASYPYAYDGAGNVLSIGNMTSPSNPDTYTYDTASRLIGATVRKSAGTPLHTYAYQYDVYGNLTGRAESAQGYASLYAYLTTACGVDASTATDYVRNLCFTSTVTSEMQSVSNKLGTVSRGGTLTVNGSSYVTGVTTSSAAQMYSGTTGASNGNVIDDGTYTYSYDPLNRLVAVRLKLTNQLQYEYFYDAAGERSAVIQYTGGTKSSYTQYLRDGSQVVYEKVWALPGYTVSAEKYYLYVQGKMGVTKQVVSGTATYTYYGTDHLGTVRATATFSSGGVYQGYTLQDYEPYGMEIPPRDTTSTNTHKYTGHERDVLNATPGSYYANDYMHFRGYASNVGRFLRPDSIGGTTAIPAGWNCYAYVLASPIKQSDPTGHEGQTPGAVVGGEAAPPGAYPDMGTSTWWFDEYSMAAPTFGNILGRLDLSLLSSKDRQAFVSGMWAIYSTVAGRQFLSDLMADLSRGNLSVTILSGTLPGQRGWTRTVFANGKMVGFVVQLDFSSFAKGRVKAETDDTTGTVKWQGLDRAPLLQLAETIGHELMHVEYALLHPDQAAEYDSLTWYLRAEARKGIVHRDLMQRMEFLHLLDESAAYLWEKKLNSELQGLK